MSPDDAASGGPALRRAWERAGLRPAQMARELGVSPRALRKWAAPGARTPPARVAAVADLLKCAGDSRDSAREDVLSLITAAAAAGRGLTVTELRARRRQADTDELLAELRDGALPLVHVRDVVAHDSAERLYVRPELHPGPPAPAAGEDRSDVDLTGLTIRGLRLLAGYTQMGFARRLKLGTGGRQQIQAWETDREKVPAARRSHVRDILSAGVRDVDVRARRKQIDMSGKELCRQAGLSAPVLSMAELGTGRPLTLSELAAVGIVLDRAERMAADELAAAVAELVRLVAAAEPNGLTGAQLERARSAGRVRGNTGAAGRDAQILAAAIKSKQLVWSNTAVPMSDGKLRSARRLHLAATPVAGDSLAGDELAAMLRKADVSASELARSLGMAWGTVSKWTRGVRAIAAPYVPRIREALSEIAARPRRDPAADVLAAAHASPGLPRWRLFKDAGYGKNNPAAAAALADLIKRGELHLEPRPRGSLVVMPGAGAVIDRMPGAELRSRRQAANLRQSDLATMLDVEQTAVSFWERKGLPAERRGDVERALTTGARPPVDRMDGAELRRRREAAGLTKRNVADFAKVTDSAVTSWERRGVPARHIAAVEHALATRPRSLPARMAGAELHSRRQAAGLTKHHIARHVGVTDASVTGWELRGVPRDRVAAVKRALRSGVETRTKARGAASPPRLPLSVP